MKYVIILYFIYVKIGKMDTLLDWDTIQQKMPWGIVFLMGGGMCLAKASNVCGHILYYIISHLISCVEKCTNVGKSGENIARIDDQNFKK